MRNWEHQATGRRANLEGVQTVVAVSSDLNDGLSSIDTELKGEVLGPSLSTHTVLGPIGVLEFHLVDVLSGPHVDGLDDLATDLRLSHEAGDGSEATGRLSRTNPKMGSVALMV